MERNATIIIALVIMTIITLCTLGFLRPSNPIVELATDIACDVTDENVCEQIRDAEK